MKLSEVDDQEAYIYIRYLAAIAGRFNVGDYIKTSDYQYDDDLDKTMWRPNRLVLDRHYSRIDSSRNVDAWYTPIYKVVKADGAYIEACRVDPLTKEVDLDDTTDLVGYSLRDTIENIVCDIDSEEQDADILIEVILNHYIKLDDSYADSLVMEIEYIPYADSLDVQALLKDVETARERERKELLRQRAIKGHATRRIRKERAIEQAAREARAIARLAKQRKGVKRGVAKKVKKSTKKKR